MTTQANLGWMGPDPIEIVVTNRTASAVAVGDVELLDLIRSDAASTTNQAGLSTAGLANIVVPLYDATTQPHTLSAGIYGVVLKAAADDAKTTMRLRGYQPTVSVSGTVVLLTSVGIPGDGSETAVIVDAQLAIDGNASTAIVRKVIFLPLTARTGAGTTDGMFDGINGFGYLLSTTDLS